LMSKTSPFSLAMLTIHSYSEITLSHKRASVKENFFKTVGYKDKDLVHGNFYKGTTSVEQTHKETRMRTDGQTFRENEMVIEHEGLESVKQWAKATFTRERMVEVAIYASALTSAGAVLFSLHRAMENYIILGF